MNANMIIKAAKVAVPAIIGAGAIAGTVHFVRKGLPAAKEIIAETKEDLAAVEEAQKIAAEKPEVLEQKGLTYNSDDVMRDYITIGVKATRGMIKTFAPAIVCGAVVVCVGVMGVYAFNRVVLKPRAEAAVKAKIHKRMGDILTDNNVVLYTRAEKLVNDAFVHGSTEPGCVAEKLSNLIVNVCNANGMSTNDVEKLLANDADTWTNLLGKIDSNIDLNSRAGDTFDWSNVKHWTDMYVEFADADGCLYYYRPWIRKVAKSIRSGEKTIRGFETFVKSGFFNMYK